MNKQALINALFSSLGAFVCIGFLAYLNSSIEGAIWLIPPFGASMVLVMAVHESPLAKPKNLILGHILSALSGVNIFSEVGNSHSQKSSLLHCDVESAKKLTHQNN